MSCKAASCPAWDPAPQGLPTVKMDRPASIEFAAITLSDLLASSLSRPLSRRGRGPSYLVRWKQWCMLSWLLMDGSSQQGWGLGDVCADGALLAQWVLVLVFLLSLCAPAQELHSVPYRGYPYVCWGETLPGASTNMRVGRASLSAHADPHPLSAIPEQDPPGSAPALF